MNQQGFTFIWLLLWLFIYVLLIMYLLPVIDLFSNTNEMSILAAIREGNKNLALLFDIVFNTPLSKVASRFSTEYPFRTFVPFSLSAPGFLILFLVLKIFVNEKGISELGGKIPLFLVLLIVSICAPALTVVMKTQTDFNFCLFFSLIALGFSFFCVGIIKNAKRMSWGIGSFLLVFIFLDVSVFSRYLIALIPLISFEIYFLSVTHKKILKTDSAEYKLKKWRDYI